MNNKLGLADLGLFEGVYFPLQKIHSVIPLSRLRRIRESQGHVITKHRPVTFNNYLLKVK